MAEPRDVRELVGEDVDDRELDRLRRVHDLLVAAGPPPELSPVLQQAPLLGARPVGEPRFSWFGSRRFGAALALAAALAAVGFGIGYLVGHAPSKSFRSVHTVLMLGTGSAPAARATIEVGSPDSNGNIPMLVRVSGLPTLHGRSYYELFLTKH